MRYFFVFLLMWVLYMLSNETRPRTWRIAGPKNMKTIWECRCCTSNYLTKPIMPGKNGELVIMCPQCGSDEFWFKEKKVQPWQIV